MKKTLVIFFILFLSKRTFSQFENKGTLNSNSFKILVYQNQKDLDTLGYEFKLKKSEINSKKESKWSETKLLEFENKITDLKSLYNLPSNEYISFGSDLREYSEQEPLEKRLSKILSLLQNQEINIDNFISYDFGKGTLDKIILENKSSKIISDIKKSLIERLRYGTTVNFNLIAPILFFENSPDYYQALLQIKQNIGDNDFLKTAYYFTIVPELARIGGLKSIPIIAKTLEDELKTTMNKSGVMENLITIIHKLEESNIPKQDLEKEINKYFGKHITTPYKTPKIRSELNLEKIILLAKSYNLISEKELDKIKYEILYSYYLKNSRIDKDELLKVVGVAFNYNSSPYVGSGHFLNKSAGYTKIMETFMSISRCDLPSYIVDKHLRFDANKNPDFALFLGNDSVGYVIKLNPNMLLDTNHLAIKKIFNKALLDIKSKKRFTIKTEDRHNNKVTYQVNDNINSFLEKVDKLR